MTRETHIQQIALDISDDTSNIVTAIASAVYDKGYRKERHGEWINDQTYTGRSKVHYTCSLCGKWQTFKKTLVTVHHSNYCPHCGAKMTAPGETL